MSENCSWMSEGRIPKTKMAPIHPRFLASGLLPGVCGPLNVHRTVNPIMPLPTLLALRKKYHKLDFTSTLSLVICQMQMSADIESLSVGAKGPSSKSLTGRPH